MYRSFLILILFFFFLFCGRTQEIDTMAVKKSIENGYSFFLKNQDKFKTYSTRELLYYATELAPNIASPNRTAILDFKPLFDDDIKSYPYYRRLSEKSTLSEKNIMQAYSNTADLERAMFWGLYADVLPKDDSVKHLLYSYADNAVNIRQIAHGCIVLRWAKDVAALKKITKVARLKEKYSLLLPKKIIEAKPHTDSGMEGILGMLLIDKKEKIDSKWIAEIISHQNTDGGWSWNERGIENSSDDHPTTLALYILAAFLNEKYDSIKWINN